MLYFSLKIYIETNIKLCIFFSFFRLKTKLMNAEFFSSRMNASVVLDGIQFQPTE